MSIEVNGNHGFGLAMRRLLNGILQAAWVHNVAEGIDIDKDRGGAAEVNRGDGRHSRMRHREYQRSGTDAAGAQSYLQRVRATRHANRMCRPDIGGKFLLKSR